MREFGPLLREVFTPRPSPPSTIRGLSWQGNTALLLPIVALCGIIAGNACFVKGNSDQKSAAPSRAEDDLSSTYGPQILMGNERCPSFYNSIQAFLLYILKGRTERFCPAFYRFFPVPALAASRQRTVVPCAICRLPLYSVQGFTVRWGIEPRAAPPRYHMTSPQQGRSVLRSPMMRLPPYSFLFSYSSSVVQLAAWMAPSTWRNWADIWSTCFW